MAARTGARGSRSAPRAAAVIPQLPWNEVRPAPVVLVSGPESFLADRAIQRLRELLRDEDPSLEVSDLDASSYASGELFTVASPSLFAEPRMVRVQSVEKASDAFLSDAEAYLASAADDTYLVLRHGGGVRGKRLLDAVRAGTGDGIEIVCSEIKRDSDRYDFAAAEFRAAGRRVTTGALRALTSAFADDLAELSSACAQLVSDTADDITEVTVGRYYGGRIETNGFAVADAAIAGRGGEALVLVRHALASGADPVPMVAAFAAKLRTMAKVLGTRGSSQQVASALGVAPWQVDRARRDLQGWTADGLGRAIQSVAAADENIKGLTRDPVYSLERLVLAVAARGESA